MDREHSYAQVVNIALLIASIGGMFISWKFSADFLNNLRPGYEWLGFALIIIISVLELAYATYGDEMEEWLTWIAKAGYAYDIVSNILGISLAFGLSAAAFIDAFQSGSMDVMLPTIGSLLLTLCITVGLGLAFSIAPEKGIHHAWLNIDLSGILPSLGPSGSGRPKSRGRMGGGPSMQGLPTPTRSQTDLNRFKE